MVKGLGVTIDYVLYEASYANIILYGASLPSYSTGKNDKNGAKYSADDPSNNEKIRQILESLE